MGNYVTVENVRSFKVGGTAVRQLIKYSDNEVADMIREVEAGIDSITNNHFAAMAVTYLFDGNGFTKLFFPPITIRRLLRVTAVKELDIDGTSVLDTFTEDDDFKPYPYWLETTLQVEGDSPRRRFGTGGVWPKGQKNISVEGIWGYESQATGEGTVQVATGALRDVVGTDTRFLRDFRPGALVEIEGVTYDVAAVTSDTAMSIATDFTGTLDTEVAYAFWPIPSEIQRAVIRLVIEALLPGATKMAPADAKQVVWNDFTITFKGSEEVFGMSTGFAAVDRVLQRYLNHASMFHAVPGERLTYGQAQPG